MFGMGSPVAAAASCSIYEGLRWLPRRKAYSVASILELGIPLVVQRSTTWSSTCASPKGEVASDRFSPGSLLEEVANTRRWGGTRYAVDAPGFSLFRRAPRHGGELREAVMAKEWPHERTSGDLRLDGSARRAARSESPPSALTGRWDSDRCREHGLSPPISKCDDFSDEWPQNKA